jgi:SWI/SNF-related matrix-associated actin-dependent regulator of chromatin subfamily A-like protein 1
MMDIETITNWSPAKEIQTKNGPRLLRKGEATQTFWSAWKSEKDALKAQGVSCGRNDRTGSWEATWWLPVSGATQAARDEAVVASKAASAEIDLPRPAGLDYLPFQKAGIQYALARKNTLIGDEMGLGKTIMAIGVINADPTIASVVIVCPKSLKLNWQRELEKWLARPMTIGVANGEFPATDIVIASYESVKKHAEQIQLKTWGACIVDEAHYIKNAKAQRSVAVKTIKATRKIRMTGTPIVNRPAELHNIIEDMEPAFGSFFSFAKRYCNAHQNGFGWDFSGASNLDELQRRLRETIMVRRLKADVLTELPRKIRQVVEVEAETAAQKKAVKREADTEAAHEAKLGKLRAAVELSKAESETIYKAAVARLNEAVQVQFSEMSKLRHETAVAKIPAVIAHIANALDDNEEKIILAAHHHDVIDALVLAASEAGWNPVSITGDTNESDRQSAVDKFQTDPTCRLFVGSITAAGVGITLTASSHVIFAELDWVPGNVSQMEDRAHRIGQLNTVLIQHIVLNGSLDARMARMIIAKQTVIDSALDHD